MFFFGLSGDFLVMTGEAIAVRAVLHTPRGGGYNEPVRRKNQQRTRRRDEICLLLLMTAVACRGQSDDAPTPDAANDRDASIEHLERCAETMNAARKGPSALATAVRDAPEACGDVYPYRGCWSRFESEMPTLDLPSETDLPKVVRACVEHYCPLLANGPVLCSLDAKALYEQPREQLERTFTAFHAAVLSLEHQVPPSPRLDAVATRFARLWVTPYEVARMPPPSFPNR